MTKEKNLKNLSDQEVDGKTIKGGMGQFNPNQNFTEGPMSEDPHSQDPNNPDIMQNRDPNNPDHFPPNLDPNTGGSDGGIPTL